MFKIDWDFTGVDQKIKCSCRGHKCPVGQSLRQQIHGGDSATDMGQGRDKTRDKTGN